MWLPKDCWELIGKRCSFTTQFKIAATCIKLRDMFFKHFALEKWLTFIKHYEYDDNNNGLVGATLVGHRKFVEFFISNGASDWDGGLRAAARSGCRDLVDLFISNGATQLNWGLMGAAEGGHRDLVDLFISKHESGDYVINWDWGVQGAVKGGHRDLLNFFIEKCKSDGTLVNWCWAYHLATFGVNMVDPVRRDILNIITSKITL